MPTADNTIEQKLSISEIPVHSLFTVNFTGSKKIKYTLVYVLIIISGNNKTMTPVINFAIFLPVITSGLRHHIFHMGFTVRRVSLYACRQLSLVTELYWKVSYRNPHDKCKHNISTTVRKCTTSNSLTTVLHIATTSPQQLGISDVAKFRVRVSQSLIYDTNGL